MELSRKSGSTSTTTSTTTTAVSAGVSNELVLRVHGKRSTASGLNGTVTSTNQSQAPPTKITPKAFRFNPDSHVYMASACCEMLHYKHAALVVAALESVVMVALVISAAVMYLQHGFEWYYMLAQAGIAVVNLFSVGLLVFGVLSERGWLLWPHLIMQMALIASAIAFTVLAVVSMSLGTDYAELIFDALLGSERAVRLQTTLGPVWPFCLAVIFDFQAAIGIWCYILTRGCYEYIMDKQFFEKKMPPTTDTAASSSSASSDIAGSTPTPSPTSSRHTESPSLHTPTITSAGTIDKPQRNTSPHDQIESIAESDRF